MESGCKMAAFMLAECCWVPLDRSETSIAVRYISVYGLRLWKVAAKWLLLC